MVSNNQRVKRAQIVDAAKEVLATQGLAACTARAVADASPLTKSAIHYYFRDVDEIVDVAMAEHVDAMLVGLRRAAHEAVAGERLWRVVEAYLATFADRPHAAFLWFEYWVAVSRRASVGAAAAMLDRVRDLLVEVLDVSEPDETADRVLSWLLGTIVQQQVRPRSSAVLRSELARVVE
ncbi:TetR/AcrR family transcriptional regulator [Actinophytocola oryzae]|uniref:TetR family transcriptional regulator n=1 Tax=Actinophytocola oryzae TaxID=502181 RepID=A0A4V3FQI6_9PSEU|nr:TetR/AcrR family transcriptional regulator [Actinophytocola oryzae]TDV39831.1 TetR family transcriptional regulator [Actinophytocola oryzae]